MQLCYVDESGNEQELTGWEAPPVLVLAGLVVAEANLKSLIWDYLNLKKSVEKTLQDPSKLLSDVISHEIKGSDLRSDVRLGRRRSKRRSIRILDEVLAMLEKYNVTLLGYVHVKCDNKGPKAGVYPDAIAWMAEQFEAQLAAADTAGMMILDARTKVKNTPSVQTITTRKFKTGGDTLRHLVESPVFGHSDSHVVLQISDLVASALLFPMACSAYCGDVQNNAHATRSYDELRNRYGARLRKLEHRYTDANGSRRGGVVVFDTRHRKPTAEIYTPTD